MVNAVRKPRAIERRDPNDPTFKVPWLPAKAVTNPVAQAGGGNESVDDSFVKVDKFNRTCVQHLSRVFDEINETFNISSPAGIQDWLLQVQGEDIGDIGGDTSGDEPFLQFLEWMSSPYANALTELVEESDVWDYPLSNYFISSSHNTYLTGNQLYGQSNTDGYKNVLLRGCRCVEIDVWNGGDDASESPSDGEDVKATDQAKMSPLTQVISKPEPWRARPRVEPVVLHGYTATREVPFRRVCETIRENAFVTSPFPVIVSLELHTNHENQESMVEIMKHCFQGLLVESPDPHSQSAKDAASKPLPSPSDLHKKILIKVKYSSPKPEPEESRIAVPDHLTRFTSPSSNATNSPNSSDDEATKLQSKQRSKPSKIIDSLSSMGIYTRSCHFKSFNQPEAKVPTHIFSLSEGTLAEEHEISPEAVFEHNKSFLMRVFPRGTRINSSNLDPSIFWRTGAQMVALNWQRWDAAMMLNEAMFTSTGGYALKPEEYRSASLVRTQSSANQGHDLSSLGIEFFCGQHIPIPHDVVAAKFRPFVKVELHVESPSMEEVRKQPDAARVKGGGWKQSTKPAKAFDSSEERSAPDFARECLIFDNLPPSMPELSFIRFKVMHDSRYGRNNLAAWACIRLDRLGEGYRILHLFDAKGVQTAGFLFIRIKTSVSTPTMSGQPGRQPAQSPEALSAAAASSSKHGIKGIFSRAKDRFMGEGDHHAHSRETLADDFDKLHVDPSVESDRRQDPVESK